jgi:threonine dehydrogenase-like Zn-dependent dehydrogenase
MRQVTKCHLAAYIRAMRVFLVLALAFALVGCGGRAALVVVPSSNRLDWATQLGRAQVVPDPAVVKRVTRAASASGARALDVTVLAVGTRRVAAVTLQSSDPASYMRHGLRRFLAGIDYFQHDTLAFVELVDDHGRFAWTAGRWKNGGMVGSRPGLERYSPIAHF